MRVAKVILTQIYMALKDLYTNNKEQTIFISKFELSNEDREYLNSILEDADIYIEDKSTLQRATWVETKLPGVWRGVIYDLHNTPIVETIEICYYPSLAKSQRDDIKESLLTLKSLLNIKGDN